MTEKEIVRAQGIMTELKRHVDVVMAHNDKAEKRLRFRETNNDETLQLGELSALVSDIESLEYWATAAKQNMSSLLNNVKSRVKQESRNVT